MGSYAWVVSGKKTASGNPIIYSGPQMDHAFQFSVPSIVTEGSIKAEGLNISGMAIPECRQLLSAVRRTMPGPCRSATPTL